MQQALSAGLGLKGAINVAAGDVSQQEKVGVALAEGAYGFLVLAQYDAERILTDHLASLGGCIERSVELVGLEQIESAVRATLKHGNGKTETIDCRYLIGCDGGRSAVRHAMKIPFEGEHYEQTFFLVDVEIEGDFETGICLSDGALRAGQAGWRRRVHTGAGNSRRYRSARWRPMPWCRRNWPRPVRLRKVLPRLAQH